MAQYQFIEYTNIEHAYYWGSEISVEEESSRLEETIQAVIQQLQNG